jgi:hypothetical protein
MVYVSTTDNQTKRAVVTKQNVYKYTISQRGIFLSIRTSDDDGVESN